VDGAVEAPSVPTALATVRDQSQPVDTSVVTEPSDADLETAIVRAVTAGAFEVAMVLAGRLEARRRERVPANVIALSRAREG
jgi:hypothetical protein